MENNKPKRVLHVVSRMQRGGAETMIMNLYRNVDRSKVQFDFIVHSDIVGDYDEEIRNLGGRIIKCNSLGTVGPIKYIRELSRAIKENGPFHVVHAHTDFQTGFVAKAAKNAGIEKRICHSHNTQWKANPNIVHKMMLSIFKILIDLYATDYCACGKDAAKFLFNKNKIDSGKVSLMTNGIDVEKFNIEASKSTREKLGIDEDTIVIGNIARFYEQKNHKFIVELAEYMKLKNIKVTILLIGEGPLLDDIKNKVKERKLQQYIKFLGVREDIPELMNSFDVFILPSLYEGLPVVLIEAQASGTLCVVSDTITNEVDFGLNIIKYCCLDTHKDNWTKAILENNSEIPNFNYRHKILKENGYDVKENVNKVMSLYNI